MDEITLLRALAPRAESPDAAARAAALRALEGRFARRPASRRTPVPVRRRGVLAFAGAAAAVTAIVAAVLLVNSGPRAEPAAAEVLRQAATVAAAADAPAMAAPGPGQFLYLKTKLVELQGWLPDGPGTGPKSDPRYFTAHIPGSYPDAPVALVPTSREFWIRRDGRAHLREVLGHVDFLSAADQRRWEAAGSPPPFAFDPKEHPVHRDGAGRPLKEGDSSQARGVFLDYGVFPDLSGLPTEPEALRLSVENSPAGRPPLAGSVPQASKNSDTIEKLTTILTRPTAPPALRAAAFNALAEVPGTTLHPHVTDVAGRQGEAIAWESEPHSGFQHQFIFDPRTSEVLADAQVLATARAASEYGVPAGTVFRETAYLRAGIVDALAERAKAGD
jgi:hypothetical protein